MKRRTLIFSDKRWEDLHSGKYGLHKSHKFSSVDVGAYDKEGLGAEINLGPNLWIKLGEPSEIKITITTVK